MNQQMNDYNNYNKNNNIGKKYNNRLKIILIK